MWEWITNLNPSDKAAWYGAFIATITLFSQIIGAIRKGPKLSGKAIANQIYYVPGIGEDKTRKLTFEVYNLGDRTTTITHVLIAYFPSLWRKIFNKPVGVFASVTPSQVAPLPFKIEPGGRWFGFANENDEFKPHLHSGKCYVFVFYDGNKKIKINVPKVENKG